MAGGGTGAGAGTDEVGAAAGGTGWASGTEAGRGSPAMADGTAGAASGVEEAQADSAPTATATASAAPRRLGRSRHTMGTQPARDARPVTVGPSPERGEGHASRRVALSEQ